MDSTESRAAMSSTGGSPLSGAIVNVPNALTSARIVLSIFLFVFLALECYLTSMVLFIVAASTDWVDGFYARRYGQITVLGRILDPFADKMIICGTFVFLAAAAGSGVRAWMTVLIVGRELLVTALRSFLEERGSDFSAKQSGKIKMVLQCLAAGFSMFLLSHVAAGQAPPDWLKYSVTGLVWGAVVITAYSGVEYIIAALRMLRR
jgi:CDP-diacylglycerol--glycerol-3-phosphate 3-phosphatidyltransferase